MYGSTWGSLALETPCMIVWSKVGAAMIHCDNQSCVKMNPVQHDRTKHMEMKYHYVREMVQRRAVELRYVPMNEQIADVLTKPLGQGKFMYFWDMLRVVENVSLTERSADFCSFVETFL